MNEPILKRYVTVAEAAILAHRGERTIRRWMNAQLLTIYRRKADGQILLDRLELPAVGRAQRQMRSAPRGRVRREHFQALADLAQAGDLPAA